MTPNQLPPLPEPDTHCFDDDTGKDVWSYTADQMHAYALAALAQQAQVKPFAYMADDVAAGVIGGQEVLLSAAIRGAPGGTFNFPLYTRAQQAQEPVAAALGEIVALWDKYAPSEYMTAIHMQAKRALAGQQPVSPDMHRWCAYVGGMVACWITSEPDAHARLGDDKFEVAIAGIIERRLWAMPKRDTTPPAPQPAPVDERAEFEESMREKHGWVARDFQSDSFGYFDGHTATAWLAWQARAALQSPAPQTKGGEA